MPEHNDTYTSYYRAYAPCAYTRGHGIKAVSDSHARHSYREKPDIGNHFTKTADQAQYQSNQIHVQYFKDVFRGLLNKTTRLIPAVINHPPKEGKLSPKISVLANKNTDQTTQIHPASERLEREGSLMIALQICAMVKCNAPIKKQNV